MPCLLANSFASLPFLLPPILQNHSVELQLESGGYQDPRVDAEKCRTSEPRSNMWIVLQRVQHPPNLFMKVVDSQQRVAPYLLSSNCIPYAWKWKREENNGFILRSNSFPHPKNLLGDLEILQSGERSPSVKQAVFLLFPLQR